VGHHASWVGTYKGRVLEQQWAASYALHFGVVICCQVWPLAVSSALCCFPCPCPCHLQLVEVSAANSRSYGINRAGVDRVNDLRPGSQDFRALDATVVEVRGLTQAAA